MKPAAPEADQPPSSPARKPLQLLRWQARTQELYEELGDGAQLTMVRIPAGSFQMGAAGQEPGRQSNEGPVHEVTLVEFLIGPDPDHPGPVAGGGGVAKGGARLGAGSLKVQGSEPSGGAGELV